MEYNYIKQGDCLELMKDIPDKSVDMILSSPPYNITKSNQKDMGYDLYKDWIGNDDYCKWSVKIFNEFDRLLVNNGCVL